MENFKIKKDGFQEIRKAILVKAILISLFALIGGLAISHFNSSRENNEVNIIPILLPILLAATTFGIYSGIKRQKEIFESYILTLDMNGITREQHNTPVINIPTTEITQIIKNSNGSFTIKGSSAIHVINVPSQIEDYEKLEKLLSEIGYITSNTNPPFAQKYLGILSILVIFLMATVYIAKDKIIVGISGTILLIGLSYSLLTIQKSKNIDHKTKKGTWWILLVLLSLIGTLYFKLTNQQ